MTKKKTSSNQYPDCFEGRTKYRLIPLVCILLYRRMIRRHITWIRWRSAKFYWGRKETTNESDSIDH